MIWVIIRFLKVIVIFFCLISISNSNVFASSIDDMLLNSSYNNDFEMVKTAVANGADVNYHKKNCCSPLGYAVINKNPTMAAYLLEQGADVNGGFEKYTGASSLETPLLIAIANDDLQNIGLLVKAGADVNLARITVRENCMPGQAGRGLITPLIMAIKKEGGENPSPAVVQFLIMKNADVNQATTKEGFTPLMAAACFDSFGYGNSDIGARRCMIAQALLKAGADPAYQDEHGKTALQYAIDANFREMIKILLPVSPK